MTASIVPPPLAELSDEIDKIVTGLGQIADESAVDCAERFCSGTVRAASSDPPVCGGIHDLPRTRALSRMRQV
jgi:hypothetical protein